MTMIGYVVYSTSNMKRTWEEKHKLPTMFLAEAL